jgi:hypothetical protein
VHLEHRSLFHYLCSHAFLWGGAYKKNGAGWSVRYAIPYGGAIRSCLDEPRNSWY